MTLPALAGGLMTTQGDDTLIISGGRLPRVFTGAAATRVLPRLLPLLDGHHTAEQIAHRLELPTGQVAEIVALLDSSGLLDHEPDLSGPAGPFWSRLGDPRGSAGLRRALSSDVLHVAASGPLAALLEADLRATGVALSPAVVDDPAPWWRRGTTVLPVTADGHHLDVGPLLRPGHSVCPACLAASRKAGPVPPEAAHLAAALATAEVVALLLGHAPLLTGRRLHRIDLRTFEQHGLEVFPEPGCATCEAPVDTIARHEWLVRRAPWDRPAGEEPDRWRDADLGASPRFPLPDRLAGLIRAACDRPALDTYLIGAPGLPYPVHRYSPRDDVLIATRADVSTVEPPEDLPAGATAWLVLVATPGRLHAAHGEAALRRSFLRAGRVLARLPTGAHRLVWTLRVPDGLRDLLELDRGREQVAAVVGVYER
ncbi:hypothetical protein ACIBH1_04855 [Nonomuraea sp. NPDC050663]|uniref:hypothetical protein n=1 Tax=Nonomuraea sp. NPDC050663 TaxID=3364370 RepID=UPI00379C8167